MSDKINQQFMIGQSVRLREDKHMHGFRKLDWPPQITVIEAGATGVVTEASMRSDVIQYHIRFDGYYKGNVLHAEDLEPIEDSERKASTVTHEVLTGRVQSDIKRGWEIIYGTPKHERAEELEKILWNLEQWTKPILQGNGEYELLWTTKVFW